MTKIKAYLPSIKAKKKEVFFEAHYWGSYQLMDLKKDAFKNATGKVPIAMKKGFEKEHTLLVDPKTETIFRSENLKNPIAYEIDEFLGPPNIEADKITSDHLYFDKRKKLEELIPPDLFILTGIHDPEHFEEVENYFELIDLFTQLSYGQLKFDDIDGREKEGNIKEIYLKSGRKKWTIELTRELFDNQIIDGLNDILKKQKINDYQFATTINENMEMVLLKLPQAEFDLLERMGLLI